MSKSQTGFPHITAEEAASHIFNGATIGFSGFTPAGAAKATPRALAARAKALHAKGEAFQVRVLTGASTGVSLDETLAQAEAISWRAPYQSSATLRKQMNSGKAEFVDMHLSHVQQTVAAGFFGKVDFAVVEATEVTADGRVYLTTSIGASPTYLQCADKVIVEVNRYHSPRTREMADITILPPPPYRNPIPIHNPLSKIGWPYAVVDPKKIIGIVETNEPDEIKEFSPADVTSEKIASNVVKFLLAEMAAGRIPKEFLPLQSGVGNVANAVLANLGANPDVPPFTMYTEVFQDACVDVMLSGKMTGASATSLTLTEPQLQRIYANMDFFAPRICLRPQEFSNNPGIVRRLGIIAMNTAIEVDVYGHANSTHVCGVNMMNGIGGSGDFVRNAFLSIFMCPSYAKGGKISTIVPMCTHVDHNEHSVQIVVTDQGLADLRGLGPIDRARKIIDNCAHPAFRPYLHNYLEKAPPGHIRHDLRHCFDMHLNLQEKGAMLPDIDLKQFPKD
jgi:acetyl-CoA hydrolase